MQPFWYHPHFAEGEGIHKKFSYFLTLFVNENETRRKFSFDIQNQRVSYKMKKTSATVSPRRHTTHCMVLPNSSSIIQ